MNGDASGNSAAGGAIADTLETKDSDSIYRALKDMIIDGRLPGGGFVNQVDVARMFGVSRTPVRESLRRLQAEGLIEGERNQRMRVTSIRHDEIDALYAQRIFMESMGIALSVPRMTQSDMEELQAASRAIDWRCHTGGSDEHDRHLRDFKLLAIKYGGDGVRSEVENLFDRCERVRKFYQSVLPGSRDMARDEHKALLLAISEGRTEDAVFIASRHLGRTALAVLGYMAPDYEPNAIRYALAQTGRPLLAASASEPLLNIIGDGPVARNRRPM